MNVGSSSILVTFVLLCLVTFAALSYVSANADNRLAVKTGERIKAYYEGDSLAETYLADIDSTLKILARKNREADYYKNIADAFKDNTLYTVEADGDNVFISYEVDVTDTQKISVRLMAVYPEGDSVSAVKVMQWQNYSVYIPEDDSLSDEKGGFLF